MTANAMEGDRELCMAAGMDDYVAKPVRVEELVAALGRCRPRGGAGPLASSEPGGVVAPAAAGAPAPAGAPAAAGAIDRAAFDRLTATMDTAFVAELIDTFLEDARGLIASLRRALAAADRDAFRRAAHSLKSTSESLGATDMATLARELETIGRSGVPVGCRRPDRAARRAVRARHHEIWERFDMALPADTQSGRLLVVDDNRVNRLLLGRALEQLGHTVTFAENGREGLEGLRKTPFDLVLLDIEMPEMDGYQVLAALAVDPQFRDLPMVMMSSVEEVDSVARCIEMGAEDYLFKPVNPMLLRARVGASLEKKRLRDRQRELFRQFATAEVAEELLKTGLTLGGKHVEASVMFSDIRAFTSLTEARSPVETIELLNSYYTLMFDAIGGHGGIVNQMLGDGLMAIFGAPLPHADHRERAVRRGPGHARAGGGVQPRAEPQRGRLEIRIGIGIAAGPLVAGFTGTQQRVTYTCVGETVNLAAHLEAHTKVVGRPILIDENTRNGLGDGRPRRRARAGPAQDAQPRRRDLLRPRSAVDAPRPRPREWQNWSGSVACRPAFRAAPTTESEVADAGRAGPRGTGQPVARGRHRPFLRPALRLRRGAPLARRDPGLVSADPAAGLATVWAGSTIQQLGPLLRAHGLAMANMGDIDRQAIAGAVSTGTHGTGRGLGSISTQVAGLRLVTGEGGLLDLAAPSRARDPRLRARRRWALSACSPRSPCACSPPTASTSGSGRSPSTTAWRGSTRMSPPPATSSTSGARAPTAAR